MEWINKKLFDNYELIGDIDGHVVRLSICHPKGIKLVKEKHMTQIDFDNCDLDNIRQYFSRQISSIQLMTIEQIQIYCN